MTDDDFPAAHSMDTEWFAVDACGHVGHFSTAEAGGVPIDALPPDRLLASLAAVVPPGEVIFDVRALRSGRRTHEDRPRDDLPWDGLRLVALRSVADAREALLSGEARVARDVESAVVIYRRLEARDHDALHASGACLACTTLWQDLAWNHSTHREPTGPATLGLFEYDHALFENGLSGPYTLGVRPANPLKVTQTPMALRAAAERVTFSFCFADARHLQPADHVPTDNFNRDRVYVSADGRTLRAQEASGRLDAVFESGWGRWLAIDRSPWRPLAVPPPYLGRKEAR